MNSNPQELGRYFGKGLHTDEIFMDGILQNIQIMLHKQEWKENPIPMFANAALVRPGYKPGQYPSAGPLPHIIDIWKHLHLK